ncbi:choline dehydrogenase-like flavoprotein [Deinococcus budaensis]|uniref:Choline dehydrogenase-like flavoprotein n=1 Tax=Deinococcus budaensis TaxID=1665626 RepID=A0A7W8GFI6_9DEIO|nr:GMC family oxidoreductase N-terminal domain-containing protein [Deinococcus budaensis]MBB5234722.1 choline dehydrogenase-like flavoprotein [Deinococcus budaensis]
MTAPADSQADSQAVSQVTPLLTATQQATLKAFADTVLPRVDGLDPPEFWGVAASDLGVHQALAQYLDTQLPPEVRGGLLGLLDAMASLSFAAQSQAVREAILRTVAGLSPEAAGGVGALRQLTLLFGYGLTDERGQNPLWPHLRYPGPPGPAPQTPKTITPHEPEDGAVLEADAVVIGSGSGGGVVAASLAQAGKSVVVLEAGGYFNEADFHGLELNAYQTLYYRGGYHPTADGNVTLVAGAGLGGGSTVNWSNSVRPRDDVRRRWAHEHGLTDVAEPSYDAHIDAVLARMGVNDRCSDFNGPHQRLQEGSQKLGYQFVKAALNLDPGRYDPDRAGYAGFGDATGAKQGTLKTFLQDAHDAGARILVRTQAERILVEEGRAAGVQATATVGGEARRITVRAPQVVVACGALETPALLLRSGIGGPAVGKYLRLHPVGMAVGVYGEDQRAWWGPPQSAIMKEFADREEGYGFIIESVQYGTALLASGTPWTGGVEHKAVMSLLPRMAFFINITQDHGHGQVTLDAAGNAVHTYALTDDLDARNFRAGLAECVRLHEAAGAEEIHGLAPGLAPWKRGEDLEAFIAALVSVPPGAGGQTMFSAHQMGSARMGLDPQTSVADVSGQLHDVPGVWIGDTSAFPTCSGVNPMVSCMALAHRTASRLLAVMDGPPLAASPAAMGTPAPAPAPLQLHRVDQAVQPASGLTPEAVSSASSSPAASDLPGVTPL